MAYRKTLLTGACWVAGCLGAHASEQLVDECSSWEQLFSRDTNFIIRTSSPQYFSGDSGRFSRASDETSHLIYEADNVSRVEILYYHHGAYREGQLELSASTDTLSYQKIAYTASGSEWIPNSSWYRKTLSADAFPEDTNFLKIEISGPSAIKQQIARIVIDYSPAEVLSEPFADFSKITSLSPNVFISEGGELHFGGDPERLTRIDSEPAEIVYKLSQIGHFELVYYYKGASNLSPLEASLSAHGVTYTPIELATGATWSTSGGWTGATLIPADAIPAGFRYLKFRIAGAIPDSPSLSSLRLRSEEEDIPVVRADIGSIRSEDLGTIAEAKSPPNPTYRKFSGPVPTNDVWTHIMLVEKSEPIIALPLRYQFVDPGLSISLPGKGTPDSNWVRQSTNTDLYLRPRGLTADYSAQVADFGDWSVETVMVDTSGEEILQARMVLGSPFLFGASETEVIEIEIPQLGRFFDDRNESILAHDYDEVALDHLGVEVANGRSFGIFLPLGSSVRRAPGGVLEITLGDSYFSLAGLPNPTDLDYFYRHAYAFVTDTKVSWAFDQAASEVRTDYTIVTESKRADRAEQTLMALLPHQWKHSSASLSPLQFETVRGAMKVTAANAFSTTMKFHGILPGFNEPLGSVRYDTQRTRSMLESLVETISLEPAHSITYWQGKKLLLHASAIQIADQLNEIEKRDTLVSELYNLLADWFTYSEGETQVYFNYHAPYGTLVGIRAGFGSDERISDHHFHYGMFILASAVLAHYRPDFVQSYGHIVDLLIRDMANPSRDDPDYPFLRCFDPYLGHSWADGIGNHVYGNNQESSSEAMASWAGVYLWGLITENDAYRDLGIYGYVTELSATEQYWFDVDGDNFHPDWSRKIVGRLFAGGYTYTTWFGNQAEFIYGIQWIPPHPFSAYLGYDFDHAKQTYANFLHDNGGVETHPDWHVVILPYQALTDPSAAIAKFEQLDPAILGADETHTYWMLHSYEALGTPSKDIWSTNWSSYQSFKREDTYTTVIFNSTTHPITVDLSNASGTLDSVTVPAGKTVTHAIRSKFQQWSASHRIPDEEAGPEADPDRDGVINLVEYALGGDPLDSRNFGIPPQLDPNPTLVTISYPKRNTPNSGVNYTLEVSSDLLHWVPAGGSATESIRLNADFDQATETIPWYPGDQAKFLRLHCVQD